MKETSKDLRNLFRADLRKESRANREPVHRTFLKWYLRTRFGADAKCDVTDGPSDGGIDAIVTEPRPRGKAVWVVQSKFSDHFWSGRASKLALTDYTAFDAMPSRFENDELFDEWLGTVADELKPKYRNLRRQLRSAEVSAGWHLLTLHARSRTGEDRLQLLTPDGFIYGEQCLQLYLMSREGATPPAEPLNLRFTKSMIVEDRAREVTSYVFAAFLKDFVDFMDHDTEDRLFARNVRLDLKTKINKDIRKTYVEAPHEFWYSHNGITVVCTKAAIEGQNVRLVNPSVINGSQTLHSLRGVTKRDPEAQVLTRVLVVKPEEARHPTRKFVNDVVFRMNQQNPMKASNLRANDDQQVAIAGNFVPFKIFYERREADWNSRKRFLRNQGFERLRSRDLAQILAACDSRYGPVVAKGKIDRLFDEPAYDELFYQDFPVVCLKWLLHEMVRNIVWDTKIRGTRPRQRRQAQWAVLHVVHECLRRSPVYGALLNNAQATNNLRSTRRADRLYFVCEALLRETWTAWVKANRRDRQLDPNNFFKAEKTVGPLVEKLVRKYRRRTDVAARDLLKPAD